EKDDQVLRSAPLREEAELGGIHARQRESRTRCGVWITVGASDHRLRIGDVSRPIYCMRYRSRQAQQCGGRSSDDALPPPTTRGFLHARERVEVRTCFNAGHLHSFV